MINKLILGTLMCLFCITATAQDNDRINKGSAITVLSERIVYDTIPSILVELDTLAHSVYTISTTSTVMNYINDNSLFWNRGYTIVKMNFSQTDGLTMETQGYLDVDKRPLSDSYIVIESFATAHKNSLD